jgi:hypothetical protein
VDVLTPVVAAPATGGVVEPDGPRDDPAGGFELVAANLEWSFAAGTIALDGVDAALVRYAGSSDRLAALFRSWVADPAGGWVRVVMAYVGSGSISGVETERSTIVDLAQRSGAKRCCIEIIGLADVGDVHQWLEDRSVALWRAPAHPTPVDAAAPAAQTPASAAEPAPAAWSGTEGASANPTAPAGPAGAGQPADAVGPRDMAPPASPATPESGSGPAGSAAEAAPGEPPPVGPPTQEGAGTRPAPAELPADATFQPGPGEDEPALAALVEWAPEQAGVLGLVTAWTEVAGRPTIVVGVVVDGEIDQPAVRAEVLARLDGLPAPVLVESFAPSRGLSPSHLRLYRSSTRLWTRKVERAPTNRPGVLQLDTTYHAVDSAIQTVIDVSESIDDEQFDGFTLVGLDLNASVQRGAEEADDRDDAVVAWIREQPHALAALRATTEAAGEPAFPVYSVLVDADADRAAIRRGVARVIAGTGVPQAGVEVFCPFERIAVFHVQLYGASLNLWKTDQPPPSTPDESTVDDSAADPADPADPAGSA